MKKPKESDHRVRQHHRGERDVGKCDTACCRYWKSADRGGGGQKFSKNRGSTLWTTPFKTCAS